MRATEIIRNLLDIIDGIDQEEDKGIEANVEIQGGTDELRRFKHIVDLVTDKSYSTAPDPKVLPIAAVTTDAGGGVNGPKHPRDLRGNSFPIYPEEQ